MASAFNLIAITPVRRAYRLWHYLEDSIGLWAFLQAVRGGVPLDAQDQNAEIVLAGFTRIFRCRHPSQSSAVCLVSANNAAIYSDRLRLSPNDPEKAHEDSRTRPPDRD